MESIFRRDWVVKQALAGVSLRVGAGEIVGLVGANGAGKTTLVKALAGIIHPTSGSAQVLGYTPWHREIGFRKQIALVMGQKAQLWWDLPAADCFVLLREIYQIPKREFQINLDFLTDALKVRDQLHIQIRRLSLGERMKMELIAALVHQPKVVFLDEPTIGLDLSAQRAIREFLLQYRRERQPAMLLTSHYMEDIEQLCERIIIMREGAVIFDGPLKSITRDFARHKMLTARLSVASGVAVPEIPVALGDVVSREADLLKLRVDRDRMPESAAWVLKHFPVLDLNIEEEDISSVIEALLRRGTV